MIIRGDNGRAWGGGIREGMRWDLSSGMLTFAVMARAQNTALFS